LSEYEHGPKEDKPHGDHADRKGYDVTEDCLLLLVHRLSFCASIINIFRLNPAKFWHIRKKVTNFHISFTQYRASNLNRKTAIVTDPVHGLKQYPEREPNTRSS